MKLLADFTTPSTIKQLPAPPISSTGDIEHLFGVVLLWMFWGLMVLSVAMFLIGGYKYATSRGETEKTTDARRILIYAAVAAAVGLIAAGVPYIVGSFLGTQLSNL